MQSTLQFIAGQMKKPRERFETILEPLQALLQIGFLAFYPIGSKLAIHNNILTIQAPGYTQNVRRWYNNDKKEDVFSTNSIRRYLQVVAAAEKMRRCLHY